MQREVIDMGKLATLTCIALILAACAIGPDYRRPTINTPQAWRIEEKEAVDVANTAWWEQLDDPVLNDLMAVALRENKDLKIAAARVEEYVGRYWAGRSQLFPQIYGSGSGERQRSTERGPTPVPSYVDNPYTIYQGALSGSWEIDVWGRLRRLNEAARADLLSTEEGRRSVILTLVASVANSYISLRDLDKQLVIARQTAKSREDSYDLFKIRFDGGVISELELSQIRSEYELAASKIPSIEKLIAFQENALSLLLGKNPGPVTRGKTIDELALPSIPADCHQPFLKGVRMPGRAGFDRSKRTYGRCEIPLLLISLTGIFGWSSTDLYALQRTFKPELPEHLPLHLYRQFNLGNYRQYRHFANRPFFVMKRLFKCV